MEAYDLLVAVFGEWAVYVVVIFFFGGAVLIGYLLVKTNKGQPLTSADFGSGMCPGDEACLSPHLCNEIQCSRKEKEK